MVLRAQLGILAIAFLGGIGARCADGSRAELSEGDVPGDSTYQAIDYTLTSDNYRKWLVAQDALDSAGMDDRVRIDVHNVSDDEVDDVIQSIEDQPQAKAAIESASMSVRDFVLTSIALAQSWDALESPGVRVAGLPRENLELLRAEGVRDSVRRVRASTRFIVDDDHRGRRGHGKAKAKGKHKGKRGRG